MNLVARFFDWLSYEAARRIPGTQMYKVDRFFSGRILFAINGHIQVCRPAIEPAEEEPDIEQAALVWYPCDNADQLEPAARAYLASIGKSLDQGQFVKCPPVLAARAVWSS